MSTATSRVLEFPTKPDKKLVEKFPDFPDPGFDGPDFDESKLVTIQGHIGQVVQGEYLHLHHVKDYRSFYKIPMNAIYSCEKKVGTGACAVIFIIKIHVDAMIRYYHAATIDLKAEKLADAVALFNQFNNIESGMGATPKTTDCPNCPPGCCDGGNCRVMTSTFLLEVIVQEKLGLTVSTPKS